MKIKKRPAKHLLSQILKYMMSSMPSEENKKIFIGVAWPYVNGDLHIGHYAGYLLPADVCARYNRLRGRDVLMISGSDCFGTPITVQADKEGKTPSEIVVQYHERDVELFKLLGLSYDLYTKTDTPNHKRITQDFFIKLLEKGYIFKDFSNQYYSETDKRFLPDRYVEGKCPNCGFEGARSDQCDNCGSVLSEGELINPVSKISGSKVTLKRTEHYFLDWPKLQHFLEKFAASAKGWRSWVINETKGWLKQGLKPRAITRDLDWGVKLPISKIPKEMLIENASEKRIYVWFDAVIGYFSGSLEWAEKTENSWEPFWHDKNAYHYYFMGKDNLIFHTLFWPGQLHVYDEKLKLPDFPAINQFLNLEGEKFSKSRGIIVDTKYAVEKYGNDTLRFYLCLIMPENNDSSFSWDDFYEKVNNVLIGNFGNFVNRVLTLSRSLDFSDLNKADLKKEVLEAVEEAFKNSYSSLDDCRFKDYLSEILTLSDFGNLFMSRNEPWKVKEADPPAFRELMFNLSFIVIGLSYLISPLLPETAKKLSKILGFDGEDIKWPSLENLSGTFVRAASTLKITSAIPLFKKLDKSGIEEEKKQLPLK